MQGVRAVDLDKLPTVQWTDRTKTEEFRQANFDRRRDWAAASGMSISALLFPLQGSDAHNAGSFQAHVQSYVKSVG